MAAARIHGRLTHPDGSKAPDRKITFAGAGMKDCFSDSDGYYEIEMPSGYVKKAFVGGKTTWEGYLSGGRLDLVVCS